jgi:hypothetical protein
VREKSEGCEGRESVRDETFFLFFVRMKSRGIFHLEMAADNLAPEILFDTKGQGARCFLSFYSLGSCAMSLRENTGMASTSGSGFSLPSE